MKHIVVPKEEWESLVAATDELIAAVREMMTTGAGNGWQSQRCALAENEAAQAGIALVDAWRTLKENDENH
jgi:hypothetical protein